MGNECKRRNVETDGERGREKKEKKEKSRLSHTLALVFSNLTSTAIIPPLLVTQCEKRLSSYEGMQMLTRTRHTRKHKQLPW